MNRSIISQIKPQWISLLAFFIITILYPLIWGGPYWLGAGITIGTMAVGTVGFVLLMGYARLLALGQAAFFMIGGYGTAILTTKNSWDPMLALIVSMVVAMIFAYITGKPILRLQGFNLAMASLAFLLLLIVFATEFTGLTGGALGTTGVPKFSVLGWKGGDLMFYYVVWFFVAITIIIGLNIKDSHVGRGLRAIAASEVAASSIGVDLAKYKVQMFVLSAGVGSVSGSLTVHYIRIMEPHVFGFQFSLNIITAVIIGGLNSIWGGVLGAAIIIGMREAIRSFSLPLYEVIMMGFLIVLVLILLPNGVAGVISSAYHWATGRLFSNRREEDTVSEMHATERFRFGESPMLETARRSAGNSPGDSTPLLILENVSKRFGRLEAVTRLSFSVEPNHLTALIGPNGAGKTTLFNLISGHLPLDEGLIKSNGHQIGRLPPHRIASLGIGRTFQNLQLFDNMTVLENVMAGGHLNATSGILKVSVRLPRDSREEHEIKKAAERLLAFVGLSRTGNMVPSALPFGHQRLLEIARALASEPSLLLLDEPASGLNDSETEQMAELIVRIQELGTTVLLVEHDMRLVMGLADHIVVLNYGQKIAEGSPEEVRSKPEVVAAYLGSD